MAKAKNKMPIAELVRAYQYCANQLDFLAGLPAGNPLKITGQQATFAKAALKPMDAMQDQARVWFTVGEDPNGWGLGPIVDMFLESLRNYTLTVWRRRLWEAVVKKAVARAQAASQRELADEIAKQLSASDEEIRAFDVKHPLAAVVNEADPPDDLVDTVTDWEAANLKRIWLAVVGVALAGAKDEALHAELTKMLSASEEDIKAFHLKVPLTQVTDLGHPPSHVLGHVKEKARQNIKEKKETGGSGFSWFGTGKFVISIFLFLLMIELLSGFGPIYSFIQRQFMGGGSHEQRMQDEEYRNQEGTMGGGAGSDRHKPPPKQKMTPARPDTEDELQRALNPYK